MSKPKVYPVRCSNGGVACFLNIYALAGLTASCEACAPGVEKMRGLLGWQPFAGTKFFMSAQLTADQSDAILDAIARQGEGGDTA